MNRSIYMFCSLIFYVSDKICNRCVVKEHRGYNIIVYAICMLLRNSKQLIYKYN